MPQTAAVAGLEKRLFLKERELGALLEITQAITHDSAEADLYKIYQFTLIGQLGVRRLALYVLDEGAFRLKVNFGTSLADDSHFLPAEVADWCPGPTCLVKDLSLGAAWQNFELLVPVRQQEDVQALVFVGTMQGDYASREALSFLETLSNILLGAVANLRLARQREALLVAEASVRREIEIAQQVQQLLFPQHLPNNARYALHATYQPHTEIGGDYYDVVEIDPHRLLVCVADVSGKGVPASLLMSNFQAGLRTLLRQGADLVTIVRELNHLIFRNSGGEKFITAFLALYDRRTQVLEYVNAGHNDPLLLPDAGPPQPLHDGTVMLGIMPELPRFKVGLAAMPPHSLLFIYTDGLTEVFDAQQQEFGEGSVLRALSRNRYLPLPRLHQELLACIRDFNIHGERFADDVTMLSLRVK
ncbi:PP2C family protein-serine/threonine phosphatase [Hymenobacter sp. BRD128]|uniref:PP2C family protein-serine/threonine phosphatase n=1 Tax=Hymenobacter sp. BRD128 TaxID=2675878 RepID=UPI00156419FB|nr:PP2C family protein-serine/threonine phosphatase [Hymenobacter sp. BRD128]QKG56935.1 PP2C family protein-serine/threonine phosphatase [Hymenobacter sp. BRD128]